MKELGIYIHIPFCKSKCIYCDFNSFVDKEELIEKYISSVKKEIQSEANNYKMENALIKTIYIGGGTPSFIDGKYIKEILDIIKLNFSLDKNAEITIEVNPGTTNLQKLKTYYENGINRLSVGLQSSNNELLKQIGRIHNYNQFLDTIKYAKKVGFKNINVDVMLGLPNQTIYDVEDTLNNIIKLELTHISIYSLIVEPKTKIEKLINNGKLQLVDEEIERYMYWFAKRKLEENEYIHYEISNFSKIDYRSKHNVDCWNQKEYIGFGVSASSYKNKIRYKNIDDIEQYIKNIENKEQNKNRIIEEIQTVDSMMNEYMLLGLRKINGININEFRKKFNKTPLIQFNDQLSKLIKEDLIAITTDNIRLTKRGLNLANLVWEEFI